MSARGVEVFRRFFEKIVEQCQQAGLVWGKELYVNATKVKANASLDSLTPRFAVEAHLSTLYAEEAEQPTEETEQVVTQEEAVSHEPGEQEEMNVQATSRFALTAGARATRPRQC